MKKSTYLFFLLVFLLTFFGCVQTDLSLRLDRYVPSLDADKYQKYNGLKLCLSNVGNEAANTSIWSYYSADGKIRYSGYSNANDAQILQSYHWYAYKKALESIGMQISQDCTIINQKELWLVFKSFNDQKIVLRATAYNNTVPVYQRDIELDFPSYSSESEPQTLVDRGYSMTDQTVSSIIDDPVLFDLLRK